MSGTADWGFLDDFYLTKQMATASLQERIQRLHAQLQGMEEEYMSLLRQCALVNADLDKIEEKAAFVVEQAQAVEAMFEPPAFEVPANTDSADLRTTKAILDGTDKALLGVWAVAGLRSWATMRPFKAAQKTLGAKSPLVKAMQASPKFKRAKALGKLSSRAGAAGLVIMGTMWLLSIKDADKLNAALKENARSIKDQIAALDRDMDELRAEVRERRKELGEMLGEADVTTVGAYVIKLNEALGDLAMASTNTATARRMLLDGMPVALVERATGLDADQVAVLTRRVAAERALLAGDPVDTVAAAQSLSIAQVVSIAAMQQVRGALVEGTSIEMLIEDTALPGSQLESERTSLMQDLKPYWSMIQTNADVAQIAQRLALPLAPLQALSEELQAKTALLLGRDAPFGTPAQVQDWQAEIDAARALPQPPQDSPARLNFAVAHRMPLSGLEVSA